MKSNPLKLILAIAVCELVGIIGSFYTSGVGEMWYSDLAKSRLTPSGDVIGIVWVILYALMGFAVYLVWKKGTKNKDARKALVFFCDQLVLNLLWSVLFFGLQRPVAAFIEILALWIVVLLTIVSFGKVSKQAAMLLIPYLAWISFAAYLNYVVALWN